MFFQQAIYIANFLEIIRLLDLINNVKATLIFFFESVTKRPVLCYRVSHDVAGLSN